MFPNGVQNYFWNVELVEDRAVIQGCASLFLFQMYFSETHRGFNLLGKPVCGTN